ncbi:MAG: AAA family ATPase [Candidatus Wallbacteria bacterium]|nr:AAA family ATPase [Candidatus Wallbacteria bacterium]
MSGFINFFGFQREPFPHNMDIGKLYHFPGLSEMTERFKYTVSVCMVHVITGAVGSGKSTSLRYACSLFHPARHKIIPVIANTGSMIELLKQISFSLDLDMKTNSITNLLRGVKQVFKEIFGKKLLPILVIDEAHLMRERIFFQMHTLLQCEEFPDRSVPLILCGQNSLIDKLVYHTAGALASRVIGKTKFEGLDLAHMTEYINHHLAIAGIKDNLFAEAAITAIHQGSGGVLRKANNLARGALVAAAGRNSKLVSADHVRIAATEIL